MPSFIRIVLIAALAGSFLGFAIQASCATVSIGAVAPASRGVCPVSYDGENINDAVQVSDGSVWVASSSYADHLLRWGDGKWNKTSVVGVPSQSVAMAVCAGPASSVYCLWRENPNYTVFRHASGADPVPIATLPCADYGGLARIDVDSRGSLWLSGYGAFFCRIDPKNGTIHKYELSREWHFDAHSTDTSGPHDALLQHLVEDTMHRMWVWSGYMWWENKYSTSYAMHGVCIIDSDGRMTHYPALPGVPDQPIVSLTLHGADHAWVGLFHGGLYEVSLANLTARRIPDPAWHAFDTVRQVFCVGAETYVCAAHFDKPQHYDRGNGTLWKLHGGVWSLDIAASIRTYHLVGRIQEE